MSAAELNSSFMRKKRERVKHGKHICQIAGFLDLYKSIWFKMIIDAISICVISDRETEKVGHSILREVRNIQPFYRRKKGDTICSET